MHVGQLGICLTGWQKKHTMAAFFVSRWHGPRRNKVTPAVNSVQLNLGDFSYAA